MVDEKKNYFGVINQNTNDISHDTLSSMHKFRPSLPSVRNFAEKHFIAKYRYVYSMNVQLLQPGYMLLIIIRRAWWALIAMVADSLKLRYRTNSHRTEPRIGKQFLMSSCASPTLLLPMLTFVEPIYKMESPNDWLFSVS